jgi:putative inorganic carbon (hco3(-)) transporter
MSDTYPTKTNRVVQTLDKVIQFSLITFVVFSLFSISITQISFALGGVAWLIKVYLTQSWRRLKGTLVGIAILLFSLATALSIITAVDWESSITVLKKLIQFAIFFWVANTVQDERQRNFLIKILILAGSISAMNGIIPVLDESYFRLFNRISGTMSVQATFSGLLMLSGLLSLAIFLFSKPRNFWALGGVTLISLCLLYSLTRQAWLGFLIGSVFLLFFWNKKFIFIIPVILIAISFFSHNAINDHILSFTNFEDPGFQARLAMWKEGWKVFMDYPLTGCGYKCVDSLYIKYTWNPGHIKALGGLHSNQIQLLVDAGILGLGTWLSIWVAYFIEVFKRWRTLIRKKTLDNAGVLMGSSAAVLAFLAGGCFETNIYDSEVAMLLYFLMGLSLAKAKKASEVE